MTKTATAIPDRPLHYRVVDSATGAEQMVVVPTSQDTPAGALAVLAQAAAPAGAVQLANQKAVAKQRVRALLASAAAPLFAAYAEWEVASFAAQEAAARAYNAEGAQGGENAPDEHLAMLDDLRALSGRSRADQANKIMAKVALLRPKGAQLIALREQADDAIDNATAEADVQLALQALQTALASA